jgi:hypothetical protein
VRQLRKQRQVGSMQAVQDTCSSTIMRQQHREEGQGVAVTVLCLAGASCSGRYGHLSWCWCGWSAAQ